MANGTGRLVLLAIWLTACGLPARADPVLRDVVLSSGGVGQFVFEADVEGGASLKLDVPLDQVDDVLKSLVVDDPAGPSLGVRLAGLQPLSESFRTLPFKPEAFGSADTLLASLVGESVTIPSTGAHGAILSVSPFEVAGSHGDAATVTRHLLTIATAAGIQTVTLEDTPDIEFTSEALRGQIASALAAIAAQRVQDRRTLLLTLAAGGPRHVRFGYVVAVPVWKTSYRLTLPVAATAPARLQAYAVVENLSGRDWRGVSVTLTSGQPVLFRTPLYPPRFTQRPEAPVDVPGALAPPVDLDSAMSVAAAPAPMFAPPRPESPAPMMARQRLPHPRAPAAGGMPPPAADVSQSVAQVAFHLAAPVTATSGESLLLPILDRPIPAQRVALFQPQADPVHPLVALKLTNDSPGALPPGLVTLFESHGDGSTGYVGDARLPAIEPGEDRLASFAVDLGVTVDVQRGDRQDVVGGKISEGVLSLMRRVRETVSYRVHVANGAGNPAGRVLLIEQPKQDGMRLTAPSGEGVSETPEAWRVSRPIAPGATETISLVSERIEGETQELVGSDATSLLASASNGALPPPVRDALNHAAALRQELDRRQSALTGLQDRAAAIVTDQGRIRQNLMSVPQTSELHRRYLATLEAQENDLESLRAQSDAAQKQLDAADAALKAYLNGLAL